MMHPAEVGTSPCKFRRILLAIDGPGRTQTTLACALAMCESLGAELTVVGVEGRLAAYAGSIGEVQETKREKDRTFKPLLDDALAQAQRRHLAVHVELLAGPPADVMTRYAEAHRHDLIVIAHRRRGLGGYLRGSTADRVAHHAPCPVMTCAEGPAA